MATLLRDRSSFAPELVKLGDVLEKRVWKVLPSDAPELPFVGLEAIAPNGMKLLGSVPFGSLRSGGSRFEPGDVLYGRLRPYLNKVWLADRAGAASGEFFVLLCSPKLDPSYLAYLLHSRSFVDYASHRVTGDRPRLDYSHLASFEIILPPLDQQRRIVARIDELFSEIDDGEEELRRATEELETYRKSLLKAAVTGELTADWRASNERHGCGQELLNAVKAADDADLAATSKRRRPLRAAEPIAGFPELPPGWLWATVGQLGRVSGGITKNAKRMALDIKLPYLRVANVGAGFLNLKRVEEIGVAPSELDRVRLRTNDLLIVEGNGSIDQIGRSAIWTGEIDPCVHQNHLIKVRFFDPRLSQWVQLWLQSLHGRYELEVKASSTSGLHTLSISKVEGLRCPLPPLNELAEILARFDQELSIAKSTVKQAVELGSSADDLRQSILAAAFRGELVS